MSKFISVVLSVPHPVGWGRFSALFRSLGGVLLGLALAFPVLAQTTLRVGVYENPPKILLGADGRVSGLLGDVLNAVASAKAG